MSATYNNLMELDDAALMQRLAAGEASVILEIQRRHASMVNGVALRVIRNCQDAAELAASVWVKTWRAAKHFRGDCELSTWLYRVTMNAAKNRYRKHKSIMLDAHVSIHQYMDDGDDTLPIQIASGEKSISERLYWEKWERRVMTAMEKLPEHYREPLRMRVCEDMPYQDIAARHGLSVGTIKSRISRARDMLKKRLTEESNAERAANHE